MTILPTHFITAERLSDLLGINVTLVSEVHQRTGSFKFRAAFHVASCVPHTRFIAASSGNFGQALAHACQLTGKSCTIVMPSNSARVKIDAVRAYGGTVELVDTAKMGRAQRVRELSNADEEAYVAGAYDDPYVILGNATLGEEIASHDEYDAVVVPVGGGGLAASVITGLRRVGNNTPVFGAEPLIANDAARSLREGHVVVKTTEPQTIADGARTVSLGAHNWAVLENGIAGIIEVEEGAIVEAVRRLFFLANVKAEPTGALALGGVMEARDRFSGNRVACVVSGGNVDPDVYIRIIAGGRQ
jgi:threonine dehydratase